MDINVKYQLTLTNPEDFNQSMIIAGICAIKDNRKPRFVQRQKKKRKRNDTLDEQDRERENPRDNANQCHNGGYSAFKEKSTENHDGQRDQDRRHYRKTVSTTWLNMKPRTVHHYTSKPESFVAIDHF